MYWWQYLLLVNLYLVLFYGFYVVLLRMETFFNLNRAYLVTSALLSFFIPLIHYEWVSRLFITQRVQQTFSVYAHPISVYQHRSIPIEQQQVTIGNLIFAVYAIGIMFLVIRLIAQLVALRRIINQDDQASAFSFFKSIRLAADLENRDIIEAHELVHARHRHSLDVLLIETIAIINWFNPNKKVYKKGSRHLHEFIADRQALNSGTTKSEYALLLLSQTLETPAHDLVNTFFNNSLLKRRILMLQKSRSTYIALLKYGLSAPLFMLMLVLSSATIIKSHTIRFFNTKAAEVLSAPASQLTQKSAELNKYAEVKGAAKPERNSGLHEEINETRSLIKGKMNTEQLFVSVEREPQFKGGILAFYQFLAANLQYPPEMMRYNIQGKVIVTLTIEKDGSVSDVRSIRDVGYGSAEEAIRVLKKSPKWEPGYQNAVPVRVRYTLPISFDLVKEKNNSDTISKVSFNVLGDSPLQQSARDNKDSVRRYAVIGGEQFDFMSNALYLLDGKSVRGMSNVDPDNVKSIRIIKHPDKDNVYVLLYGERALNGVVLIESKDPNNKPAK